MTVIVGVVTGERLALVADSFHGNGDMYVLVRDKVFRREVPGSRGESMLIGVSGSRRFAQLLRYKYEPPDDEREFPIEYLVVDWIDPLRVQTRRKGLEAKDDDEHKAAGVLLIGYRRRLFVIHTDWQVEDVTEEGFGVVGAGREFAAGAMAVLPDLVDQVEAAERAVKAAIRFNPWCVGPVHTRRL